MDFPGAVTIARSRSPRLVLWLGSLIAAGFIIGFVSPYLAFTPERYHQFWPRRWWLLVHLAAGSVALCIAPAQYWLGVTRTRLALHRVLGRLYLIAVAVSSAASVGLAILNDISWAYGLGLLGLATAWLTTTGMAWLAILRKRVQQHRQWMIRSMVVTFGFVWFRAVLGTTILLGIGTNAERFTVAAWASWSVPLLIAEVWLQLRAVRGLPSLDPHR